MGQNNQIFVATHSPHILSSVAADHVFLLSMRNGEIIINNYKDMNSVYGKPIEIVLKDFMGLKSDAQYIKIISTRFPSTIYPISKTRKLG